MVIRVVFLCVALGFSTIPAQTHAAEAAEGTGEALILSTGFGFYQGIALSIVLDEYKVVDIGIQSAALITLLSTGGSYFLADHVINKYGVNAAQASMFNSSLIWTLINSSAAGVSVDLSSKGMLTSSLVSGWLGQGMGVLLAANVDRTAGQVALMNTVGVWSGAEAALFSQIFELDLGTHFISFPTLMADVGLLVGSYIANTYRISQTRARYLDLGALLGALAGPAALFMVYGPEENLKKWYLSAVFVGIPLGIAAAWHLTRNLDDPDSLAAPTNTEPLMVPLISGIF